MKKILSIFTLIILMSCNESSSTTSPISSDDNETLNNLVMVIIPKAYNEQDTAKLNQILHEKFQLTDDEGSKFGKTDEMEYVSKYGPSYDSFDYEVKRLDIFENGTAIVAGEGTIKGINVLGQAYISSYKTTDVFLKEKGKWMAISSHVSGVSEEVFENAPTE